MLSARDLDPLLPAALTRASAGPERVPREERLARLGAAVARVSHEIRNPLATIGGFARKLRDHPHDVRRVTRDAGIIVDEVEKLEALLTELLDFARRPRPSFVLVDVNRVVGALADVHRAELAHSGIRLVLALAAGAPTVEADPRQLERALLNLWRNAVEALQLVPADRRRVLTVRTARAGDTVRVSVSDTGAGIAPDARLQIFSPFFTTKPRGTGLGLAVVREIVDDHHGAIEVETSEHTGTTITVALPFRRPS